jgi:hypothetical protein
MHSGSGAAKVAICASLHMALRTQCAAGAIGNSFDLSNKISFSRDGVSL